MFTANVRILKCAGLWWCIHKTQWIYNIYAFCMILCCQIIYVPLEFWHLIRYNENVESVLNNVRILACFILFTLKIRSIKVGGTTIAKLINELENFDKKSELKNTESFRARRRKFTTRNNNVVYFSFTVATFVGITHFLSCGIVLLDCIRHSYEPSICEAKIPYLWFPLSADTIKNRWLLLGFQSVCVLIIAWQTASIDILFGSLLTSVEYNIHYIIAEFQTLTLRSAKKLKLSNVSLEFNAELNELILSEIKVITKDLQKLIRLCEDVEDVFKFIVFKQMVFALYALMSTLYLLTSVEMIGVPLMHNIVFYVAVITQNVLYCWFSSQVTFSFSTIPQAIYNNNWISADIKFKKVLMMNMIRLNKPIYCTIGNFAPLTLNVMVTIIRASYSYYAIIRNY